MALFNFKNKNMEPIKVPVKVCNCKGNCENQSKDSRFIVLGSCCKKSSDTFNNVKIAVKELGFSDEVINIGDNVEIASYGIVQTPGFVINKKVVSFGKLITVEDAKKLITKEGLKAE